MTMKEWNEAIAKELRILGADEMAAGHEFAANAAEFEPVRPKLLTGWASEPEPPRVAYPRTSSKPNHEAWRAMDARYSSAAGGGHPGRRISGWRDVPGERSARPGPTKKEMLANYLAGLKRTE